MLDKFMPVVGTHSAAALPQVRLCKLLAPSAWVIFQYIVEPGFQLKTQLQEPVLLRVFMGESGTSNWGPSLASQPRAS